MGVVPVPVTLSGQKKKVWNLPCDSISVQRGTQPPKYCRGDQPRVSLQGKSLYLGEGSQFKTNAKDWIALQVQGHRIVLESCKQNDEQIDTLGAVRTIYTLTVEASQTESEVVQFGERLQNLWDKYGGGCSVDRKFIGTHLSVSPSKKLALRRQQRQGQYGSNKNRTRKQKHFGAATSCLRNAVKTPWDNDRFEEDFFRDDTMRVNEGDKEQDQTSLNELSSTLSPANSNNETLEDSPHQDERHSRRRCRKRFLFKQAVANTNNDSDDESMDFSHTKKLDCTFTSPKNDANLYPSVVSRYVSPPRSAPAKKRYVVDEVDEDENDADADANLETSTENKVTTSTTNQATLDSFFVTASTNHGRKQCRSVTSTPPSLQNTSQSVRFSQSHHSRSSKKSRLSNEASSTSWLSSSPIRNKEQKRLNNLFGYNLNVSNTKVHPQSEEKKVGKEDKKDNECGITTRQRRLIRPNWRKPSSIAISASPATNSQNGCSIPTQRHTEITTRQPLILHNKRDASMGANDISTNCMQRLCGLRNLGNTCYLNASLQMLYTCRNFLSSLHQTVSKLPIRNNYRDNDLFLARAVCGVDNLLQKKSLDGSANPRLVKEAMDSKSDKFVGFEQRDAHEFLSDLVDHLHEELADYSVPTSSKLVAEKKELTDPSKERYDIDHNIEAITTSPRPNSKQFFPTDDFLLTVQVCLKCKSCGYTRKKEEMYRHLSLDIVADNNSNDDHAINAKASLETSLAHFFQPEVREIKCEKCEEGTHAEQTLHIVSRPNILLLHLKRFIVVEKTVIVDPDEEENRPPSSPMKPVSVEYLFRKNKTRVELPLSLTLDAFYGAMNTSMVCGKDKYLLQSVVHHVGSRASSGHYIADAVRHVEVASNSSNEIFTNQVPESEHSLPQVSSAPKNEVEDVWFTFDDSQSIRQRSELITQDPKRQETAYMLLYSCSSDVVDPGQCTLPLDDSPT